MIWALAAMAAGAVAIALVWPLLRRAGSDDGEASPDLAVYRDQLAELERERARGLIGDAEAASAHAEIARRMIAAGRAHGERVGGDRPAPIWSLAAVALVPAAAFLLYAAIGSPGMPSQPAADPRSPAQQAAAIRGMVEGLAARLARAPDDVEGWRRLARARFVLGEIDAARAAAENAASRAPDDLEVLLELADLHAPAAPADPLSPMFVETLRRVVALDPRHVQALFFLGMDAFRREDRPVARRHWEALLAVLPPEAPVAADIRRRLETLGAAR
jgi:cytochrome c-type biogenesis protein CcmH